MADAYTRPYGDATVSAFLKMGEHPLVGTIVNTSGNRSPYTHAVARPAQGDAIATGGTAVRGVGSDATGEHSGPCFAPQTTISFPNSPESAQVGRALRTVPSVASKTGNGDFWDNRAYAGEVIG
jgi:hypothetical protein